MQYSSKHSPIFVITKLPFIFYINLLLVDFYLFFYWMCRVYIKDEDVQNIMVLTSSHFIFNLYIFCC